MRQRFPVRLVAYGALLAGIFLVGAAVRFRLPQAPIFDPDTWGYLHPAVSALSGGPFQHTDGRDSLYPAFLWVVLRTGNDFRAICVIQHLLGLGAGGLMLLAWRRFYLLLQAPARAAPMAVLVAGAFLATVYLTAPSAIYYEHCIRPEAVFPFFALLSIWLNLEFIRWRWFEKNPKRAAWLGAAVLVLSVLLYKLKPAFGLGAACAALPVLLSLAAPAMTWRLKGATVLATIAVSLIFVLPERALRKGDPLSFLFLPDTLFVIHADLILDQMNEDAARHAPVPFPAEVVRALQERLRNLLAISRRKEMHPYRLLGFRPDYLLYTDNVFHTVTPDTPEGQRLRASIGYYYYFRAVTHQPRRMLAKAARMVREFYRFRSFKLQRLRHEKSIPLARKYARNIQLFNAPELADIFVDPSQGQPEAPRNIVVAAHALTADCAMLATADSSLAPHRLVLARNLLLALYTPTLLAALALSASAIRRRQFIGAALTLWIFSYNFGGNLTIAIVHSMQGRYIEGQLAYTLFSVGAGLLFLATAFNARRSSPSAARS